MLELLNDQLIKSAKMKTCIYFVILLVVLSGCQNNNFIKNNSRAAPLDDNEGYLGMVFNSLDPLSNIEIVNSTTAKSFYIGGANKGTSLKLLNLVEGEYCLHGFDVYNLRVDFKGEGFCTYIEPGELNYFNTFIVRDPVTVAMSDFNGFVKMMANQHSNICLEYIGEKCNQ